MIKTIGTIGPSSIRIDVLKKLKSVGLDSFRINLSHSNEDLLEYYYQQFESAGVLPSLDTQGAQIRISGLNNTDHYYSGDTISIGLLDSQGSSHDICLNHQEFFEQIEVGDEVKMGFDGFITKIIHVDKSNLTAEAKVLHNGEIGLNKAIDVTNRAIKLPALTDFDIKCIKDSSSRNIQEIFVSFCSGKECIMSLKTMLTQSGLSYAKMPKIIAKIESRQGLLNLEKIIKVADGILIDRGDLSREVKISMIPGIVAKIIKTCKKHDISCYIATNVLDSMMNDKLPSRAEISDIYNLLSLGTSGFVLAAEVAIGNHPVESVEVIKYMSSIYFHQKNNTGIIPSPKEIVPTMNEPLLSWL
tara:strand:- start:3656 stop:4729 length:1074 start_codon:yes stop_codon:yes gene_type:complete